MRTAVVKQCDIIFESHGVLTLHLEFGGIGWGQGAGYQSFKGLDFSEYLERLLNFFQVNALSKIKNKVCVLDGGDLDLITTISRLPHEKPATMDLRDIKKLKA